MEWPTTKSDSSATVKKMSIPDYGNDPSRIDHPTISSSSDPLSADPIKVSKDVKYKQYENGVRVTTDFSTDQEGSDRTAGFDGTKTIMPGPDDNFSDINTSASKR